MGPWECATGSCPWFLFNRPPPPPAPAYLTSGTPSLAGAKAVKYLGPLPVGSWLILFNCFIYGFTFRLDKAAVGAAGKEVYYM